MIEVDGKKMLVLKSTGLFTPSTTLAPIVVARFPKGSSAVKKSPSLKQLTQQVSSKELWVLSPGGHFRASAPESAQRLDFPVPIQRALPARRRAGNTGAALSASEQVHHRRRRHAGGRFGSIVRTELMRQLGAAGAVAADPESARVVRIEHARPRYGEDVFNTTLAMETQQNHALHFSKGCYLGQEIVERVRPRGHVNRVLVGLEIDSMQPPDPGTILTLEGNEVGKITSAAFSWVARKVVRMAYVRAQHAAPETVLMADGSAAITTPLAAPLQVPETVEATGAGSAGRRCR